MSSHRNNQLPDLPGLEEDFHLIRELGRGGSAIVYLARDRELGRDVAIKLIRPTHLQDEEALLRLEREARTVGRLQHPNIVMLLGTRRLGSDALALILQYVPGRTLKEYLKEEGPLSFPHAESVLADVAKALAYAHRHRIVHRDVKPENVYLDEEAGMARLADFGIARAWDSDSGLTLPGTAIGTPTYMSPEQVEGADLDGRSDIYSLGLLGYEILSGRQPWEGESLYAVIYKQKNERLPPLPELRPRVPLNLRRALDGALQKRKGDRWSSADHFLHALADRSEFPATGPKRALGTHVHDSVNPTDASTSSSSPDPGSRASAAETVGAPSGNARQEGSPRESRPHEDPSAAKEEVVPLHRTILVAVLSVLLLGGTAVGVMVLGDSEGWFQTLAGTILGSGDLEGVPAGGTAGSELSGFTIMEGDGQEGRPGSPLGRAIRFRAEASDGTPVPGVPVALEVTSGGGSVTPTRTTTDDDGFVEARWTLGSDTGLQQMRARGEDLEDVVITLTARSVLPQPAAIEAPAGSDQAAEPGSTLPTPLQVRVIDADGHGIPGVEVYFEVTDGGGWVAPYSTTTDRTGRAETRWTLGPTAGSQQTVARVANFGRVQTIFQAEALRPALQPRPGLAVGGHHTCALDARGEVRCWGRNDHGQTGPGATGFRMVAATSQGGEGDHAAAERPFFLVTLGANHSCGLDEVGGAFCWGSNRAGQLGDGSFATRMYPVPVAGNLPSLLDLQAGGSHTCGLTRDGGVFCWGANDVGQLGDDSTTPRSEPRPVASDLQFQSLTTGRAHGCALGADGRAHCWGSNRAGQLGRFTGDESLRPRPVGGGHRYRELAGGEEHTCGLQAGGILLCWGANDMGQLGRGSLEGGWEPTPVQSEEPFRTVTAGARFTCGIGWSGRAYCWGENRHGQLGDGTLTNRARPVEVEGSRTFSHLQAGDHHACGTTSEGHRYCWGANGDGQLGDGTRTDRPAPVRVGGNDRGP